jgi:PAS domain S-box-containing protein
VQDITEQRTVLEELARTEEQLRLAAAATRIGVFDYDLQSGQLRWDDRVRELFGIPPEAPVTYENTFLVGVHPHDRARVDAAVRRAVDPEGPGEFDIEYRIRPANGGPLIWLAARGQTVVRDGHAVRFVGTVRDITSRQEAEAELRQTEQRYRLAVRATNDAIWDWDLLIDRVLWNEALTQAHGHLPETVDPTGAWWIAHIHPEDRARVSDAIHAVIDGTQSTWTDRYRFLRADGGYATIIDRGFVIRDDDGRAIRMIGAMLDVTELAVSDLRKTAMVELGDRSREATTSAEAVSIAAEVLGRTLEASRAGYARVDLKANLLEVERDWTAPGADSLRGRYGLDLFQTTIESLRDGRAVVSGDVAATDWLRRDAVSNQAVAACAQINAPLLERGELIGFLFVHHRESRDWDPREIAFARAVADRTHAALAKLQAEAEQRLLNEELSHRLKNTLAMVLSIASQTLRRIPDRAPVEAFEQRIHALSTAHDVLLRRSWAEAPIAEVVRAVMAGSGHADRIDVAGPDFELGPRATLSLSLLLHELVTNAVKYGALSVPGGRVAVTWRTEGSGETAEMVFDWRERGGPAVREPSASDRKGFGSRLIRMGLVGTGGVDVRYSERGLEASMRAPLAHLQRS